jgi:hypothetical protein
MKTNFLFFRLFEAMPTLELAGIAVSEQSASFGRLMRRERANPCGNGTGTAGKTGRLAGNRTTQGALLAEGDKNR